MAAGKLRIGVIGVGLIVLNSHFPGFQKSGRAQITAVSRRNPERLKQAQAITGAEKAFTDWRAMLEQQPLDAVVVATPHDLHLEPTLAALDHGLHVLLEKPMALKTGDARSMVTAAEGGGRLLVIGYNARGIGGWRAVKRALEADTIGRIRQVSVVCCMDARMFWDESLIPSAVREMLSADEPETPFFRDLLATDNWRSDPDKMGGGMFVDSGSHVVDVVLWLGGAPAREVVAEAAKDGQPVESSVNCQGRLTNDVAFSIAFDAAVSGGDEAFYGHGRLTAFGEKGVLTADWTGFMATAPDQVWIEREGVREKLDDFPETLSAAEGFVASILDGAPVLAPPREAARVVALTEAVYRSSAERKIIPVQQL